MFIGPLPKFLAGLDVGELLAGDVHRQQRVEVNIGSTAMACASCSEIGAADWASAVGAAAAPRQRDNVSGRIPRNMSNLLF